MEPALVVDLLDEVGKVFGDILERLEGHGIDTLDLQCLHEALGVVVGIAPAAHRTDQTMIGKKLTAISENNARTIYGRQRGF